LNNEELQESERNQVAGILKRSVSSLHDMLNNLMELARLEAGHEKRTSSPFDAAALLSDVCLTMQPLAQAQGLLLRGEGPRTLLVEGDRAKVQRILQNLVLNALKYTQRGEIIVTWQTSRESDSKRWMISVQDTGPGFEGATGHSMLNRLREATQGAHEVEDKAIDDGTSSNHDAPAVTLASQSPLQEAGEGIGLSIVKGLCDLLDATLELETSPGQGSTFRVTFPCSYPQ
jgi:signal transduction histidine kinase